MKKLRLSILSAEIEWHWWFIKRTRRRGNSLLTREVPLSSQSFYKLNKKLSIHSRKVIKAQTSYDKLMATK